MMAYVCLSVPTSKTLSMPSPSSPTTASYKSSAAASSSSSSFSSSAAAISAHTSCLVLCRCSMLSIPMFDSRRLVSSNRGMAKKLQLVRMAPDEEKLTRRNPLDFPIVSPFLYILISGFDDFPKFMITFHL